MVVVLRFSIVISNLSLHSSSQLTLEEKMSAQVVGKDAIGKNQNLEFGSADYKRFVVVFSFEDCIKMCQLCRLSYWDTDVWASKKVRRAVTLSGEHQNIY